MWIESKTWPCAVSTSSITVHLDRLAVEVAREGWQTASRYDGPHPLIQVFDRDIPNIGESITLVPGRVSGTWWYRSSAGEDLAPHTKPIWAAKQITRLLIPYVTAVRAARSHQRLETGVPSTTPPAGPDPSHAPTIAELEERFAGVLCWWGTNTARWWAIVPGGTRWRIINARDPDTLVQEILKVRKGR